LLGVLLFFLIIWIVLVYACSKKNEPDPFGSFTPTASPTPTATPWPESTPALPAPSSSETASPLLTFPRVVTISHDFSIPLEYGRMGLRRGQPIRLLRQNGTKYDAANGTLLFTVEKWDFEEIAP
jgi:hypothetical protein